ncbi:SEC14-like protein 2, partial [Araneus ventricosus]
AMSRRIYRIHSH